MLHAGPDKLIVGVENVDHAPHSRVIGALGEGFCGFGVPVRRQPARHQVSQALSEFVPRVAVDHGLSPGDPDCPYDFFLPFPPPTSFLKLLKLIVIDSIGSPFFQAASCSMM